MDESEGLIVDDPASRSNGLSKKQKIIIGVVVGVIIVLALIIGISVGVSGGSGSSTSTSSNKKHPNIIFLIGDGLGPQMTSLARIYTKYIRENEFNLTAEGSATSSASTFDDYEESLAEYHAYHNDPLDGVAAHECEIAFTTTFSDSSVVTDSAASATALSSGVKTTNGFIGLTPEEIPVGHIIEAASFRGYTGGIVCTSRVTHATPGGFTAHVNNRNNEELIALQQATLQEHVSVYIGGGANKFSKDYRADGRDLLAEAEDNGFTVATDIDALRAAEANESVRRLLAPIWPDQLPYELERDPALLPSLDQNLETAWNVLKRTKKPFFMMVEGSLIDFCGHNNDPAAGVKETLAFFKAVDKALELAQKDKNTLVFVVADHDTGGISLSGGFSDVVSINFEALRRATLSVPTMITLINEKANATSNRDEIYEFVRELLIEKQGFDQDYDKKEYIDPIVEASNDTSALLVPVTAAIADNAGITYGTYQHTATNVLFYSCLKHWQGKASKKISIKLDTAEIPKWIGDQFGFDFEKATEESVEIYKEVKSSRDGWDEEREIPCTDKFHCRN